MCRDLVPVHARTRVVLLQHPREARLAICSAWLTRISLSNAELHCGFRFSAHPRLRELTRSAGTALLYPGPGATLAGDAARHPPEHLLVIDATWKQSEKMLEANPELAALPRLSVLADGGSGYEGLRREPAPHCLSTIEAVALALGALEGDAARFAPMRVAFREAVARQLACARGERRNPRHRRSA